MFPISIRHAHTFEATVDGALTAIYATIHVIFEDEAFGGTVECDKFDGFGGTIFYAKATTCTGGRVVVQITAETLWGRCLHEGIELCAVLFEQ